MRLEIAKNLLFAILWIALFGGLVILSAIRSEASPVYTSYGEVVKGISVKVLPEYFATREEAEKVAKTLPCGDVFQNENTKNSKSFMAMGILEILN